MKKYLVIRVYPPAYNRSNLNTLENKLNDGYSIYMYNEIKDEDGNTYIDYILINDNITT